MRAIQVLAYAPLIIDGKLHGDVDTIRIYYYKDIIVFKKDGILPGVKGQPYRFSGARYRYFVYHQKGSVVYRYDSLQSAIIAKIPIDTFLYENAFAGFDLYRSIYKKGVLLSNEQKEGDYSLVERITRIEKIDESYSDTVYLYFQRKDLFDKDEFSLSKFLDSAKQQKLVKSRFIYNAVVSTKYPFPLPAREIWFELTRLDNAVDQKLLDFFERTRNEVSRPE